VDVPVQPVLRNGFKMYRFTDRYLSFLAAQKC